MSMMYMAQEFVAPAIGRDGARSTIAPHHATPHNGNANNAEDHGAQQNKSNIYVKTKMCKFQMFGVCRYGNNCNYAHSVQDLKELPNFAKTSFCKTFLKQGVCRDVHCPFAHKVDDLREGPAPRNRWDPKLC